MVFTKGIFLRFMPQCLHNILKVVSQSSPEIPINIVSVFLDTSLTVYIFWDFSEPMKYKPII